MKHDVVRLLKGGSNCKTFVARNEDGSLVVRKIENKKYSNKLPDQHYWLHRFQSLETVPEIYQFTANSSENILDIEYFENFQTLSHLKNGLSEMLIQILEYSQENLHTNLLGFQNASIERYIEQKISAKIQACLDTHPHLEFLFKNDLEINGRQHLSIEKCLQKMRSQKWDLGENPIFIHGDLTFENVLFKGNQFRFIDPNSENPVSTFGVEVGKILQSLHGQYESIDQMTLSHLSEKELQYDFPEKLRYSDLKAMDQYLLKNHGEEFLQISYFHEAVHFCRLLPYKAVSQSEHFPKYVIRTIEIMNHVIQPA